MESEYGYIVRVVRKNEDSWLGQRVYMRHESVIVVKHNVMDSRRFDRVYVLPATKEQHDNALSVVP